MNTNIPTKQDIMERVRLHCQGSPCLWFSDLMEILLNSFGRIIPDEELNGSFLHLHSENGDRGLGMSTQRFNSILTELLSPEVVAAIQENMRTETPESTFFYNVQEGVGGFMVKHSNRNCLHP